MICEKCGKELPEGVEECVECASLVEEETTETEVVETEIEVVEAEPEVVATEKKVKCEKKGQLFFLGSAACLALAFMFTVWGMMAPYIQIDLYLSDTPSYAYFWIELWCAICVWATSACALGFGITALVLEWKKENNETLRLMTLLNLMFCVAMAGVSVFMALCAI